MRLFVAIDLPDAVRDRLEDIQGQLKVGRLTDPETFHITLAFLGEVDDYQLETLNEALSEVSRPPVEIRLGELGTFGAKNPRTVWAGVEETEDLRDLRRKVRSALRRYDMELPREKFRPHVTLARLPPRLDPGELEQLRRYLERYHAAPMPGFTAETVTLFRSRLRPDGARHEALADYPLEGD